jgi:hypothetical protein
MISLGTLAQTYFHPTSGEVSYYQSSSLSSEQAGAIFATVMIIYVVVPVITYVIYALLLGQIFHKAGQPRWIAWVPFYNNWKLLELGNQPGFWAVLAIIPFVNIASAVFMYIAMYYIGLKFSKSGAWVVLAIFLPIVWMAILALDSSKYDDKKVTA